jgi:hypothetical protein
VSTDHDLESSGLGEWRTCMSRSTEVMVQIKARLDPRCRLEVAVGD